MFSTKNAAEAPANTGGANKYLNAGINEHVKFAGFEAVEPEGKSPYLKATFSKGEDQDLSQAGDKFYMSEKAQGMSLRKIEHIFVDGLGVDKATLDNVTADTLPAYAAALNKLIPKKQDGRVKFVGEEYLDNTTGQTKVAKRIGLPPFFEPMSVTETKLKYSASDAYDYKKLAVPDTDGPNYATPASVASSSADDLPF